MNFHSRDSVSALARVLELEDRISALEEENKKLSARELGFRMQITKLEKVAEAAVNLNIDKNRADDTTMRLIYALRAAGYLGEVE